MLPVMASWCWTTPALRRAVSSRFHSLCRSAVSSGVRKAKSPSAACSGPCACCEIALSRGRLVKYPAAVSHSQQRSGGNAAAAMHAADSTGGQRQKCKLPPPNTNAQNTPQRAVSVLSSVQRHRASVAHRTSCCTGRRSVCRPLQAAKPQISEWHSDTRWRCSILRSHPTHLNAR